MTVYVDDVRLPFWRMVMCDMWADTDDELHAMADRIGVARRWFQQPPKASWKHYDIALSKKALALASGAICGGAWQKGDASHAARVLAPQGLVQVCSAACAADPRFATPGAPA